MAQIDFESLYFSLFSTCLITVNFYHYFPYFDFLFHGQTHGIALHVSCLTQLDYTLIFMAPKKVCAFSIHSLLRDRAFKQIMSPGFSSFMTPVNRLPYMEPCPGGF